MEHREMFYLSRPMSLGMKFGLRISAGIIQTKGIRSNKAQMVAI